MKDLAELMNGFVDAFNERDLDALRDLADPGIVLHLPSGATLEGHDGLISWARKLWPEDSETPRHVTIERLVVRDDTVFGWLDIELRWRESDEVAGHNPTGIACRFAGDMLVELTIRPDREALAEEVGIAL
jgi:hypothetical protein